MLNNEQLKLIEENAKWVKTRMDENTYSLNYEEYKNKMQLTEEQAKHFDKISEYQTNLTFESLPYESKLFAQDTILKEKRVRWHESLSKDIYIEEALHVLEDLGATHNIKKIAATREENN